MFQSLRKGLARLEGNRWGALLLRAGLVFLVFFPWNYRFIPVAFKAEDIDPVLLAACQAEGIDIFNPAQWATAGSVWVRWCVIVLCVSLGWWMLSLLMKSLQRRWGLKAAILPLLLALGLMATVVQSRGGSFLSHLNGKLSGSAMPVWGGWMEGYTFTLMGFTVASILLSVIMVLMEGLHLAGRTQHLLEDAKSLALRSHLAPHFLNNALNTLHALVDEDPKAAQSGIERLTVVVDVPEELLECAVPVLGVQVLVENAVKHSIAARAEGGTVRIQALRDKKELLIRVFDPGQGQEKAADSPRGARMALDNLRSRLRRPSDLVLTMTPEGHCASFRVPLEVI